MINEKFIFLKAKIVNLESDMKLLEKKERSGQKIKKKLNNKREVG